MRDVFVAPVLAGLLLALPSVACAGTAVSSTPPVIPTGAWAGEGARATVTSAGVDFAFHCGAGHVEAPPALDGEGRFDLPGWFERRAGPEPYRRTDARYRGRVSGGTLTLDAFAADGARLEGPFTLTLGGSAPPLQVCR